MIILDPLDPQSDPLPLHRYTVELDGVNFTYQLRWLARQASWYLGLYDSAGVLLISSLRLSPGWPVTARFPLSGLPPGRLYLLDSSEGETPATLDGLGSTHHLVYLDASEVAQLPDPPSSLGIWSVVYEEPLYS